MWLFTDSLVLLQLLKGFWFVFMGSLELCLGVGFNCLRGLGFKCLALHMYSGGAWIWGC